MNTYKIYTLEDDKKTKKYYGIDSVKGDRFEFEKDEEIIEKVRKMRESGTPYMWKRVYEISVLGEDGKTKTTYEDSEEHWLALSETRIKENVFKKIWHFLEKIWYRTDSKWQEVKWGFERMFRGYDRRVAWSLDRAILDMIRKNVPIMIENIHGCPNSYVVKAIKQLNPEMSEEEASITSGNSEQMNVAMALWKSDLEKLVEHCKLVEYYECHGMQEPEDENWVNPRVYEIPYKEFSREIDYVKLGDLVEKNYEWIFDFLRKHFTELWD